MYFKTTTNYKLTQLLPIDYAMRNTHAYINTILSINAQIILWFVLLELYSAEHESA